jgi:hypothetical protein
VVGLHKVGMEGQKMQLERRKAHMKGNNDDNKNKRSEQDRKLRKRSEQDRKLRKRSEQDRKQEEVEEEEEEEEEEVEVEADDMIETLRMNIPFISTEEDHSNLLFNMSFHHRNKPRLFRLLVV